MSRGSGYLSSPVAPALLLAGVVLAAGCGASQPDWYYHWACNGDPQCLATNPTGAASGTTNEGPEQVNCTQLQQFSKRFWGMPPATDACDHSSTTPPSPLVSISIEPANPSIPVGLTQQFKATGHHADGTTEDLTNRVRWDASLLAVLGGTPIATITAGGLLTASALGSNTLVADLQPLRGTTTVTVVPAAIVGITLSPSNPSIPLGRTQRFTATGHWSDGSTQDVTAQCSWIAWITSVASIDTTGLATGLAQGSSGITCTRGALTGSTTLTVGPPVLVSIAVKPANPTVPRTFTAQLQAWGTYSDGSVKEITGSVAWSSGTAGVASVSAGGLATGLAVGSSVITAASGGVSGFTTLTVSGATLTSITVAPVNPVIGVADTVAFTATAHFSDGSALTPVSGVAWSSDATAVATVGSAGLATGVAAGTATITATAGGRSGGSVVTVSLTPPGVTWNYDPGSPAIACTYGCAFVDWRLTGITWTGSAFVAVGVNGGIYTSTDGLAWTTRITGANATAAGAELLGVAWSPALARLVAVGNSELTTSDDGGATWTTNTSPAVSGKFLNGVAWGGGQFVAVGNGTVLTSPDGLAWTARNAGTTSALRAVAWSGTRWVAVGDVTVVSPDAVTWTQNADNGGTGWNGIVWSGSKFVEVGNAGYNRTSPDGITWTGGTAVATTLQAVIFTGSQFVAVGGFGPVASPAYVFTSGDGASWRQRTVNGTSFTLLGVAWSGTNFVAVGDHYYTYESH